MPRRRRDDGNIFGILTMLPWWATLITGAGIWLYLRGHPLQGLKTFDKQYMTLMLLQIMQWACLGAALVSGVTTLFRKLIFASARDIEAIRNMSWREFETLVGEAYRRRGYSVEETGGGGADGGVDLILRGNGQKTLVQCKQWKTFRVGVKTVREMYGVMAHEKADRVIIVASGTYTPDAVGFARGKPVELMGGNGLVKLIREARGEPAAAPVAAPSPAVQPAPQQVPGVQTQAAPQCPKCGETAALRTAKKGANAGGQFWGCSQYPACKGIVNAVL